MMVQAGMMIQISMTISFIMNCKLSALGFKIMSIHWTAVHEL